MNWRYFRSRLLTAVLALAFLSPRATSQPRVSFEERRAIRALINSLSTSDSAVFVKSSLALREKGGKAVPFLVSALRLNPNAKVRYQVARVLAQVRDDRGIDPLFQASRLDPDDAVRRVSKASLDALIEKLSTSQLGDRVRRDYRRFDRRSIFSLRNRLKTDRFAAVRQRAAQALADYGDERDLDALFEAAKGDSVAAVRREAAKAIVEIAYPILLSAEYRVTFYGTLSDGPDSFRERMVRLLINLVSKERDASVRLEIVKGLTRLAYPTFLLGEEVFGPLFSLRARSREVILGVGDCFLSVLREDESRPVRKEAAASLCKLFAALFDKGDETANEELRRSVLHQGRVHYLYPNLPGRISRFYPRSFTYYPSKAGRLLKRVRDGFSRAYSTDPDPGVRREAVIGLSLLGRKKDCSAILNHLAYERNEDVWLASIETLGQLGGGAAAEALLNVYRRTSNSVKIRKAAVVSIGRIGTRKVVRKLASYIHREPSREVKLVVLEALGYQRDDLTAAFLARACRDKDAKARAAAATAAGRNFSDETIPVLKSLLRHDPDEKVRTAACISLSKALGKEAADLFIAALKDDGPAVRRAAAVELGIHEIEKGRDSLASLLLNDMDNGVRTAAARSLGSIGGEKSVRPLISAVSHDLNAYVRAQAVQALLKTGEPRTAIIAILSALPKLATESPDAYRELNDALPRLQEQAHGRGFRDR